jgi:hypothetical protein
MNTGSLPHALIVTLLAKSSTNDTEYVDGAAGVHPASMQLSKEQKTDDMQIAVFLCCFHFISELKIVSVMTIDVIGAGNQTLGPP